MSLRASRAGLPTVLFMAAFAGAAFAEPVAVTSLSEVAAMARTNSLASQEAAAAARSAELAVPELFRIGSSSVATTYSWTASADDALEGASVKLTMPLLDQLGLSASVSGDLSGSLAATLSPLAHADDRAQALIAYDKAQAAVGEAERAASDTALKAALSWMCAARDLETKRLAVAVMEETYDATKKANAIDPASVTIDDLVTALQDLSAARAALASARAAGLKAEAALYAALGATRGEVSVARLGLDALEAELDALAAARSGAKASGAAVTYEQTVAALELRSRESALAAIWAFEPSLALSAGLAFDEGSAGPSASIVLTLSPDDLKTDERAAARTMLELSRKALALQLTTDRNAYEEAVSAVEGAAMSREGCESALSQSRELAGIAEFNLKSGDGSALEYRSALLAVAQAEDSLYQALADEYAAWLDLAALAVADQD